MSMRGKDRWETRYKTRLWWHHNREWIGLLCWVGGIAGALVVMLAALH